MIINNVFKAFNDYVDGLDPEMLEDMSRLHILREFKTLRFSYGRQTGVTTWICKQLEENYPNGESIMICPTLAMKQYVISRMFKSDSPYVFSVDQAIAHLEHVLICKVVHDQDFYSKLKYVFIDESSLIKSDDLKKLTELLSAFDVRLMLL